MSGRWVRRGSTVVLFGVDRDRGSGSDAAVARELPLEVAGTARPVLRKGASGAAVVDLQTRLAAIGFSAGPADGDFGSLTDAAVKAFQRSRGLVADGVVGSGTWSAIDGAGRSPWGTPPAATPSGGITPATGVDPAIESLNLAEPARSAAYTIKRRHPWVVFTSGRRDAARQASAMAGNVVRNRRWIAQTYATNPVSVAAQAWVDAHQEARTHQALADGLLSVFKTFAPRDLGRLSHHLSGLAFDVRPVPAQAAAFWSTVLSLPGLRQHFDTEGGLTIWHVGF
jgi:peptidoglycan hydrolase-like protein with peptidoglycan-binding domain